MHSIHVFRLLNMRKIHVFRLLNMCKIHVFRLLTFIYKSYYIIKFACQYCYNQTLKQTIFLDFHNLAIVQNHHDTDEQTYMSF